MENVPARAVARSPAAEWFAAAGTVLGRVWSAIRAFRGALHKVPAAGRPAEGRAAPGFGLEQGELPESYGRTKVVALAVNPYLIHVYWDLAGPQQEAAGCLRFHEAAGSAFDVDVELSAKNWYVHLWSPDQRYSVELGVRRNGTFVPLARSNPVQTPRAWPVAEVSEQFTRVSEPEEPDRPDAMPQAIVPSVPAAEIPRSEAAPTLSEKKVASPAPLVTAAASPAQAAAAAPAQSAVPRAPAPRAADVLQERLTELSGFRQSEGQAPSAPESGAAPAAEAPTPAESRPTDLTTRAETQFIPGVSSHQRLG